MSDFSDIRRLDHEINLNNVDWLGENDQDVCSVCGMRYDEMEGICRDKKCPDRGEEDFLENVEE